MGKKYTDEQKALAVQTIRRFGGMTTEAISFIREALGNPALSTSTLHEWMKAYGHIQPATETPKRNETKATETEKQAETGAIATTTIDFQQEAKRRQRQPTPPSALSPASEGVTPEQLAIADEALDQIFERITRIYGARALDPTVIKDVKGKDAVIIMATAYDKLRLARNLPTEIVEVLPDLTELHRLLGLHGVKLADLIAKLRSRVPVSQPPDQPADKRLLQ